MPKKFRRRKYRKLESLTDFLTELRKQKTKDKSITIQNAFTLTETDRISWIYKKTPGNIIIEVTCVAYDLLIKKDWVTLVYYDSFHGGILHRHTRIGLEDESDIISDSGVKKKGSQKSLLTWAMKDLRIRYIEYKHQFIKKNRQKLKLLKIEFY